jgi:acyl-CoA synthetase (NDP forming)
MSHRLSSLLEPRSIALIGASDRSNWSNRINSALEVIGFDGDVYYVNPRGGEAHGRTLFTGVSELPVVPDLAFLMVPGAAVLPAMREVAAVGIKAAVVLSAGFAEVGEDGKTLQRELAELCRSHDMVVLGPNSLGYVNTGAKVALKPFQPGEELRGGHIAVVSQSGNVTVQLMNMARSFDIGLGFAVSTGNEMDVNLGDVVDFLADQPDIRAIAVFAETFQDPQAFLAACRRARAAGKLVVCLKVGRSEAAARAAMAHTGALVGNDAVIDAFLRSAGVVRVSSPEDLLTVADTFTRTGAIDGGLALLTISGGTCDIVADRAEEVGVELPEFGAATLAALKEMLPDYASSHNPLDITGAAVTDATLFGRALEAVVRDPAIGVAVAAQEIDFQAENLAWGQETFAGMVEVARASERPVILANTTVRALTPRVREIRAELDAPTVFGGVDRILPAIRQIQWWTRERGRVTELGTPEPITLPAEPRGTWTERTCRPLLEAAGVDVVPGQVATSPSQAAEIAAGWEGPSVLKVLSDDILHKSDIGGVALGVAREDVRGEAASMFERVRAAAPDAVVEGLLVSPQRDEGVDLLVGVVREPGWGNVLAVGLGGVWAEVFQDVQRIALPATAEQIESALRDLRAWPLLDGARGTRPVDLPALCATIGRIAELSLALGDRLAAVEVNPLRVAADRIEALDAAIVWQD